MPDSFERQLFRDSLRQVLFSLLVISSGRIIEIASTYKRSKRALKRCAQFFIQSWQYGSDEVHHG